MDVILDDENIVKLYWLRDECAIEQTKRKYGQFCKSISSNILQNASDVEECINDMYLTIWNTIPPQKPASLKHYASKIIRCISINRATYNHAEKRDSRKTVNFEEIEQQIDHVFCNDSFLAEQYDLSVAIDSYLAKISSLKRTVIVLRFWYNMPIGEISCRTGMNPNTVKTILARELQKMKKYFMEMGIYNDK